MSQDITQLQINWNSGDKDALEELMPIVYQELHQLASRRLNQERLNHTL